MNKNWAAISELSPHFISVSSPLQCLLCRDITQRRLTNCVNNNQSFSEVRAKAITVPSSHRSTISDQTGQQKQASSLLVFTDHSVQRYTEWTGQQARSLAVFHFIVDQLTK